MWEFSELAQDTLLRRREAPICVCNGLPPCNRRHRRGHHQGIAAVDPEQSLERAAYTLAEFCFRNHISRPAYHRLRAEGRGPVEMRIGLNMIRITAEAERDWQRLMQEPNAELEQQAVARAVKAGEAAVKSDKHVSKTRAARRGRQ